MGVFAGVELTTLQLAGQRLRLRPWRPDDAATVYEAMQDEATHRFLTLPRPYTRADATEFVTTIAPAGAVRGDEASLAIDEIASGRLVGSVALRLSGGGPRTVRGDIGYAVYAGARGHGYAAEAVGVLTEWAFAHTAERVEIVCDPRNIASAKTALRAGFRYEGIRRCDLHTHDGLGDSASFARVPGDPPGPISPAFPPLPGQGLSDGVVLLRPIAPDDAAAIHEERTDEVSVAVGFTDAVPAFAQLQAAADRAGLDLLVGTRADLAIVDVATGSYAGSLTIRRAGPPAVGGIGYGVHPAFRGRGYTARALRVITPWAFGPAGFHRLELGAKAGNIASQRAAASGGFEPDGIRRQRLRNPDGTFGDEVRFALVDGD